MMEAILIADRVVVLNAGCVDQIVDINLPRPRGNIDAIRAMPTFAGLRYHLWKSLHVNRNTA